RAGRVTGAGGTRQAAVVEVDLRRDQAPGNRIQRPWVELGADPRDEDLGAVRTVAVLVEDRAPDLEEASRVDRLRPDDSARPRNAIARLDEEGDAVGHALRHHAGGHEEDAGIARGAEGRVPIEDELHTVHPRPVGVDRQATGAPHGVVAWAAAGGWGFGHVPAGTGAVGVRQ